MDRRQISHDILNILERLRIMHDLARDKNFEVITESELKNDLKENLDQLKKDFEKLLQ